MPSSAELIVTGFKIVSELSPRLIAGAEAVAENPRLLVDAAAAAEKMASEIFQGKAATTLEPAISRLVSEVLGTANEAGAKSLSDALPKLSAPPVLRGKSDIPELLADGTLPRGQHPASFSDALERFGTTPWRRFLFKGMTGSFGEIRDAGENRMMLGGSLVTDKTWPGDFDGAMFQTETLEKSLGRFRYSENDYSGLGQLKRFGGHWNERPLQATILQQIRGGGVKGVLDLNLSDMPRTEIKFDPNWFDRNVHNEALKFVDSEQPVVAADFYASWLRLGEQQFKYERQYTERAHKGFRLLLSRYREANKLFRKVGDNARANLGGARVEELEKISERPSLVE